MCIAGIYSYSVRIFRVKKRYGGHRVKKGEREFNGDVLGGDG